MSDKEDTSSTNGRRLANLDKANAAKRDKAGKMDEIMALVKNISARLEQIETRPATMPFARPVEDIVAGATEPSFTDMKLGEERTIRKGDPRLNKYGYAPNTVVRLKEDTEKAQNIRKNLSWTNLKKDAPILGVILSKMHLTRNDDIKYKVSFPGLGEDGVTHSELEFVKAP